jgi:hypothetical protein
MVEVRQGDCVGLSMYWKRLDWWSLLLIPDRLPTGPAEDIHEDFTCGSYPLLVATYEGVIGDSSGQWVRRR